MAPAPGNGRAVVPVAGTVLGDGPSALWTERSQGMVAPSWMAVPPMPWLERLRGMAVPSLPRRGRAAPRPQRPQRHPCRRVAPSRPRTGGGAPPLRCATNERGRSAVILKRALEPKDRRRSANKFASHSVSHPSANLSLSAGDGQCCGLLKAVTVAEVSFLHIYIYRIRYISRNIYTCFFLFYNCFSVSLWNLNQGINICH